jgi:hypothetical protein
MKSLDYTDRVFAVGILLLVVILGARLLYTPQ